MNLPSKDHASDLSASKEKERRKEKAAIVKKARKVHPIELDRGSSEDHGADPFSNPDIIWDLTEKFALSEEVDRLADLDQRQFV